ncbi:hypothetical protein [Streptomyces sp. NBC_00344]|uniref:hypothetical protein n=1 Tax=Streptomyces sp. NBC_00344 TaxID=2975720 RepID=UPI002E208597
MISNIAAAVVIGAVGTTGGTGWLTENVTIGTTTYHLNALPHGVTYTLEFRDAASRTRLTPYASATAAQLNSLASVKAAGIHFAVSSTLAPLTEPTGALRPSASPSKYHINLVLRKSNVSGMSWTNASVSAQRFAWGGDIWITPEYWSNSHWISTDPVKNTADIKNTITHEIGHSIGLDHPKTFKVPAGRAVPVMTPGPSGGYQSAANGGKFTTYDVVGINALVANGGL